MSDKTAPERPLAIVGETNTHSVSFVGLLDSGELLTGTPVVVEQTTTDLTITNKVVNTAALTINDISVAVGMAVQFKVVGHLVANTPYTVKITASTDATPAQTKVRYVKFKVEA